MILKLQIALTVLACLFVTAVFPVATWVSLEWGLLTALCALLCYGGVLLCKQKTKQEDDLQEEPEQALSTEMAEEPEQEQEEL